MTKKALLIIAFEGFRDEEYAEPKKVLEQAGIEVTTASTKIGAATGKLGLRTKVDLSLEQIRVNDYDAIAFIGGPGSYDFFTNETALNIAKEAFSEQKILAGICAAAGILAYAGVLKGKNATCFPGVNQILKDQGAHYTAAGLEIDNRIVTADGPGNARRFGEAIVKLISSSS